MELFKIFGTIALRGQEAFQRDVDGATSKGKALSNAIGKGLAKAAKVGAAAVGAAATAVGALTKQSLESYAEYEQLVGGAQLLFGDAYDYIAEKAKNAYSTVQMSQNEYLQQVNGFATGLKTALGGNEQAAAELADRIINAEADVVAATGNSQEAVQNAFNGIMKSNFTMLDNLQLGITPTKEGFQEVIDKVNDWNKANGEATDYQIDNLADCQSALVDYIKMQGLAGYAQEEAAKTISGSLASTKAAWKNLVSGLANDEADLETLISNFTSSAATAAGNIAPRVTQILNGISTMITQLAPVISNAIPVIISQVLPGMVVAGVQMIQSLLQGISQNIDAVSSGAVEIIMMLANVLINNLPTILTVGVQIIIALITGISQRLPELIPVIVQGLGLMLSTIASSIPDMVLAGMQLILGLGDGLMNAFSGLFPQMGGWIEQNIYQPLRDKVQGMFEFGSQFISELWNGITTVATKLFPGLSSILGGAVDDAVNAAAEATLSSAELIPIDAETPVSVMAENMANDTSMETAATEAVDRAGSSMQSATAAAGFDKAGKNAMQKFIDGINSMRSRVMAAVNSIVNDAVAKMNAGLNEMRNSMNNAIQGGNITGNAALTTAWRATDATASVPVNTAQNQPSVQSGITIVQNIQSVPQTPVEFAATTEAYFEQARWSLS